MPSPALLFHTIRHLRPSQVVSRAHYFVADRLGNPRKWSQRLGELEIGDCCWQPRTVFLPPEQQGNSEESILAGQFRFQNDERHVGRPVDWSPTDAPLLWQYNLHYFDSLWSLGFEASRDIIEDWLDHHAIGRGQVGWAPYPISLRLMNWCAYFFGRHREQTLARPESSQRLTESVALQTAWLTRRLEYHLLGNHVLENAAALVIVGSCFDGPAARRWLDLGLRLLRRELPEQILPDGMHFELSPMYHCRVLFVLLSLLNVVEQRDFDWLSEYASRMLDALAQLCHPDGGIALLNDSAFGVYNSPAELTDFAHRLGIREQKTEDREQPSGDSRVGLPRACAAASTHDPQAPPSLPPQPTSSLPSGLSPPTSALCLSLPHAGYFGAHTPEGHFVICDAGPVGPDYIPGHAHGDIFSFELSFFGNRIVVDSGVHDYQRGETRDYCRSTAAHSTIEVSGQDQCEFWDAFKVARRGRPHDVHFEETDWGFRLSGWHDGYHRRPGRPTHGREFLWLHEGVLAVRDTVTSDAAVPVVSRIHLHPDCRISEQRESSLDFECGSRGYTIQTDGGGLNVAQSWYCPQFGLREQRAAIEVSSHGTESCTAICLAPTGPVTVSTQDGLTVGETNIPWATP
jgi:uncharacterized heparinase superfamily protein